MAKTIFITGCSSGIGKAAAELFASKGWNVTATMRKPDSDVGKELAGKDNIFVTRVDVTDIESIHKAMKETMDKFENIDVVVNNAGYGLAGPMELVTPEQLEHQYKTNLFGPVYIMQSVLPHFRKKKKGVIVNVTSVGGRITLPFNSLYHGTKFGLEAISECVNMELKPFESIRVKTLEPGGVSTDFAGRSLVMTSSDTIKDYDPIIGRALEKFGTRTEGTSTPEQVAEVIWEAATDGKDQIRYVAGEDAKKYLASRKKQTDEEYEAEMVEVFNLLGDAKKGGAANAK